MRSVWSDMVLPPWSSPASNVTEAGPDQPGYAPAMGAVVEPGVVLDRVVELAGDPPVRAFAGASLPGPPAAGDDDGDAPALLAEVLGAYGLAATRRGPGAVPAFTPGRAEHGYETGGWVVETNTGDLPFLVDSVAAE